MPLKIHNTLTGGKDAFVPIVSGKVAFYVCGVTAYDFCHIGHARAYVVFDAIRRYLQASGYDVTYIQNFTDIDDKIIARANELGVSSTELSERFIGEFFTDMDALNIQKADDYPKATTHIAQMQAIISDLLTKQVAYVGNNGDVYFDVSRYADYGKLSKKVLDDLIAGHRVDVASAKHNPLDFVLWKSAKPGEPSWESPWGPGRPGWHIECSAMAIAHLGPQIDIHGGGEDLIFPHHENEIAQSECHTGRPFANYWVHNGFVTVQDTKMSKSLKNFFTIREVLSQFSGDVLRFYLLKTHYRTPFNFSFEGLQESKVALHKLQATLQDSAYQDQPDVVAELNDFEVRFNQALDDDFNFAKGIGILFELNQWIRTHRVGATLLKKLGDVLGIFYLDHPDMTDDTLSPELADLITQRNQARAAKDFALADACRKTLLENGIVLEDGPDGTLWKRA